MGIDFESFKTLLELEHQSFVKNGSAQQADMWKTSLERFERSIQTFVAQYGLVAKSSWGKGVWTYCPWLVMRYIDMAPTVTEGIYISFTFGRNDHSAILSLIQGVIKTSPVQRIETKRCLQKNITDIGTYACVPPDAFPPTKVDFKGSKAFQCLVRDLIEGMTFWKAPYTPQTITDAAQIEGDLTELIGIYKRVRDFVKNGGLE